MTKTYNILPVNFLIFDAALDRYNEDKLRLERYYHDLYALFMKKITAYCLASAPDETEEKNLRVMLNEIIAARAKLAAD